MTNNANQQIGLGNGQNVPERGEKELLEGDREEENGDIEASSKVVAQLLGDPSR